jgi:hypothetical protein
VRSPGALTGAIRALRAGFVNRELEDAIRAFLKRESVTVAGAR